MDKKELTDDELIEEIWNTRYRGYEDPRQPAPRRTGRFPDHRRKNNDTKHTKISRH